MKQLPTKHLQPRQRPPVRNKYPLPKLVFVDVDGTLLARGKINEKLVEWIKTKKADGYSFVLWSTRGKEHAQDVARKTGVEYLFDTIIGKPGYIVDDKGWTWIKYTKRVKL